MTDPTALPRPTTAPAGRPFQVLILMSRTGGGHLASARALEAELLRQRPSAKVTIVDMLTDHLAFPFSRMPATYDTVVNRTPRVWHAMWRMTALSPVARPTAAVVRRLSRARLEALVRTTQPDLVISVHPLVNDLMVPVLRRIAPHSRYVTVVTDLGGIHPSWLHRQNDAVYLPTPKAIDIALRRGLSRERLHALGLPVRADFARAPADRAETRRAFGLDPELPAILVMGGGGGIGPIAAIAEAISAALVPAGNASPAAQVAVVCAGNAKLKAELDAAWWPIPVTALGYVDRMSDLMGACDLLVTKAGPGTIAEASIRGLPMILYGYIPGQEAANVDHVVDAGAGLFEPDVHRLGAEAARLMTTERERLAAMAEASRRLGRPEATREIVASILGAA